MKFWKPLVEVLRNAFIILGVIVLMTVLLNPSYKLGLYEIMVAAGAALMTSSLSFVYYSEKELSAKSRNSRMVLHFILIEVVVLLFGNVIGLVAEASQNILFAVEIMVIYMIVGTVTWCGDKKTSEDINEKLASMRREKE